MVADVLVLRVQRDRAQTARVLERAEEDRKRIVMAAQRIRRMTRIYKEREDGNRATNE